MSTTATITAVDLTTQDHTRNYPTNDLDKKDSSFAGANGHQKPATAASKWNIDENGKFTLFPWDVSTLLIPSKVGAASTSRKLQQETKIKYAALLTIGLTLFFCSSSPRVRTAGLSLLFPGAGFIAVGGIAGVIGFTIAVAFLPLALFAWFGAGGLAFPLADWVVSGLVATWAVGPQVVESSAIIALGIIAVVWTYLGTRTEYEEQAEISKKDRRNEFLRRADKDWQSNSVAADEPGSRELTLDQLRFAQRILDLSLKDFDDWAGMTDIDQFQTSALRYQLYDFVNTLAVWTTAFAPSFRGYLAAGMRNAIEKSLTKKVVNYWKWESLWGNFTTNWDPVLKDNIMITGYMVQACGVYQSSTGDDRYTKEGSLDFQITEKHHYKHSIHTMYKALVDNWKGHRYTLYPCEPNWVYSMCNLTGMSGAVVYDRLYNKTDGTSLMKEFYQKFEDEFFTKGGSCIPIRSGLTGFTIPGLCGIVGDCSNALCCAATMPTLAKRMWLIAREESLRWTEDGKIEAIGLKGADQIDVGNYKPSVNGAYALFSISAAEWGDRRIANACLDRIEETCPIKTDPITGAKWYSTLSCLAQGWTTRAKFMQGGDWGKTVGVGPPKKCLTGPLLESVPYPDVLVAKAYSHTGEDLDLVLYPGRNPGKFEIKLSQLKPGARYSGQDDQQFDADGNGCATFFVHVDGRTAVNITLVSA